MSWKNMTFGTKIAVGFGLVLVLLAVVGLLSFNGVNEIVRDAEEVIHGNQLDGDLAQKEVDHLNWANKINALLTDDKVTTLQVETDDHKCAFGKWLYGEGRKHAEELVPSLAPLFKEIEEPHYRLHQSAIGIGKHFQQADRELGGFLREKKTDHLAWTHRVKDVFLDASMTQVNVEKDPTQCSLGKWMYSAEVLALKQKEPQFAALMAELDGPHRALHESAITIEKMIQKGQRQEALKFYMRKTNPLAHECLRKIDNIIRWHDQKAVGMQKANAIYASETIPALTETQKLLNEIREEARAHIMTDQVMLDAAQGTKRNVTVVSVVAIIAGILLAFFIARGIITVLKRISQQMDQGAEQVAAASGQVSSSSQQLAEGASEQAASIEETSSSLEEMSSMTKQNAANATQADTLMKEANQVVVQANNSMSDLTGSMGEISKASEETSKIIKTIDEIAFQTNLLALNAAVEAARAGEAGAGFAVVADEVRNLAMRAADAAKSTSDLIEGTVKKVNDGSELVTKTNGAFTQVAESAKKVGELVSEIAAASDEQAQGIGQVNNAVTEMDKVVQQNAANAEESASASEEMNAQAEQMKATVGELMKLVGGAGEQPGQPSITPNKITNAIHQLPVPVETVKSNKAVPQQMSPLPVGKPEKVIPLDNDDFADF